MSDDTRERSQRPARDASAPPNDPDGTQTMFQPDGHLDAEVLSAWLDAPEDFNEQDRLAIETHLTACAECLQVAADLTAIVRAFQELAFVETARSFALTPQMAGLVATPTLPAARRLEEPANLHERKLERESRTPVALYEPIPWYERQMRGLRWATAVAAMLFVFVLSADLLGNIDTSSNGDDDSSFAVEAPDNVMPASAGSEATTASGSGAAPGATEAADDGERNVEEEAEDEEQTDPPSTSGEDAAGEAPEPTQAFVSGNATAESTGGGEDDEESAPTSDDADATGEQADTMMLTEEPTAVGQTDQAQQESGTTSAFSGDDALDEDGESNALRLIELGLVIAIAWFVVAMIALPRLRRPQG